MAGNLHQTEIARNGKFALTALAGTIAPADSGDMRQIRTLRKAKGMTLEDLAHEVGVSTSTISRAERGETFPEKTLLESLAKFFGVTVPQLLDADHASFSLNECAVDYVPNDQTEQRFRSNLSDFSLVAPNAAQPERFHVAHDRAMPFGIPPGSIVVADLKRKAESGDLVIATIADPATGAARSIMGRIHGDDVLGPQFMLDQSDRHSISDGTAAAVGVVVGWYRTG